jgi:hypothetical protein
MFPESASQEALHGFFDSNAFMEDQPNAVDGVQGYPNYLSGNYDGNDFGSGRPNDYLGFHGGGHFNPVDFEPTGLQRFSGRQHPHEATNVGSGMS